MNTGPSGRGDAALLIVIMGVTASGKSTVAGALAQATGWPVLEGDDFHPPENIARMKAGIALDNADRSGWIDAIGSAVRAAPHSAPVILACSALNEEVRSRLAKAAGRGCFWVLLDVPKSQLAERDCSGAKTISCRPRCWARSWMRWSRRSTRCASTARSRWRGYAARSAMRSAAEK